MSMETRPPPRPEGYQRHLSLQGGYVLLQETIKRPKLSGDRALPPHP